MNWNVCTVCRLNITESISNDVKLKMRVVKIPNHDSDESIQDLESCGVGSSPTAFWLVKAEVTEEMGEWHWISTKDELPKVNEEVLVTYGDIVTIGERLLNGEWSMYEGELFADSDEIQWWAPLPQPHKNEVK